MGEVLATVPQCDPSSLGDRQTVMRRILEAGVSAQPVILPDPTPDDPGRQWSGHWTDLVADAIPVAERFAGFAEYRMPVIAFLAGTSRNLVVTIMATWLSGSTLVPLPPPGRGTDLEAFVVDTRRRLEVAGADALFIDDDVAALLDTDSLPDGCQVIPVDEPLRFAPSDAPLAAATAPGLAVLQFTSGSTAAPKAVEVTYAMFECNTHAIAERIGFDTRHGAENTMMVSWLPLFHDMGLTGVLACSMLYGCGLHLSAPQSFILDPGSWMRTASDQRATLLVGPNFAYALAERSLRSADGLDLSSIRIALNGAEPIAPSTMDDWVAAGARFGLDARAPFPCYGMAEVGLAATFPPLGSGTRCDRVSARQLEAGAAVSVVEESDERVMDLVKLGTPLAGIELRVVDDTGAPLGSRQVGEIELRGPSVTPGYHRDEAATAASQRDGWFRTGDLGYLTASFSDGGELVVCGRSKDMIIVAGRNIFPQDIEFAAGRVDGVRTGNVIAFGTGAFDDQAGERIVVVAESKLADPSGLAKSIRREVLAACGVRPDHIVIAEPGSIPKTSSGKLKRQAARERWIRTLPHE